MLPGAPTRLSRLKSDLLRGALNSVLPARVFVSRGPAKRKEIALTFDDGPDLKTEECLAALKELNVRGTFCLIGQNAKQYPELVKAYARDGHEVTGHGFTHRAFPTLTKAELADELKQTRDELGGANAWVRPPKGAFNARVLKRMALAGYSALHWSLDSDDCRTEDATQVARRLLESRGGEIVLLHEGQSWTLDALALAVPQLRARGFEFVTVSELFR